jgi:hypothetical protein
MTKTLQDYSMEIDSLLKEMSDFGEEEIPQELFGRYLDTKEEFKDKVERWVSYIDLTDSRLKLLGERKKRIDDAIKTATNLKERINDYVKYTMKQSPDVEFKGHDHQLKLQKNPPALKTKFELEKKSLQCVPSSAMQFFADLEKYITPITVNVLDKEKVKNEVTQTSFAQIEQGEHIRIRSL